MPNDQCLMTNAKKAILILEDIRSVENTGSIFRTAEGLGVGKIILVGTTPAPTDRFGRKRKDFAKVSLGAEGMVDWSHVKDVRPAIQMLKLQGYKIIALEQDPRANDLTREEKVNKLCLIVGNEVDGVSRELLDHSDEIVQIEMKGEKESLNVAVATGIALYQLLK